MSNEEKRIGRFRVLHGIEVAFLVLALGITIQVAYQFFYSSDRALPGATMLSKNVQGQQYDVIAADIQRSFQEKTLTIRSEQGEYTAKLSDFGASVRAGDMARKLTEYSIVERLTPFSIFFKQPTVDGVALRFNSGALEEQAEKVVKKLSQPVKNASITMEESGELKIVKAVAGYSLDAEQVVKAVQKSDFEQVDKGVDIKAKILKPAVSDAAVQDVAADVTKMTQRSVVIRVGDDVITPSKADMVRWFSIVANKKGTPAIEIHPPHITAYVNSVTRGYYKRAAPKVVRIVDDVEQAPTGGASGERIDTAAIVQQLTDGVKKKSVKQEIVARKVAIAPGTRYIRSYSASHEGLQAYVTNAAKRYNAKIAVQQLTGGKWRAQAREWDSIPSASTYKLYVALDLFRRIDDGSMRWSDGMQNTDVAGCLERMIVVSTNVCAEDFISRFDRRQLNAFIHGKGFTTGTGFLFPDAAHTTAGDLRSYLVRLYNGQLMSSANRSILLNKMGRQIWRSGIPAGTSAPVQDKVGFLWSYAHDAAIVNHPRGPYVLVVMTKGQSFGRIAQITREIEKILYP